MKELYRLASSLIRSGATRPLAPCRFLPFFRFPNSKNANSLVNLSSRLIVTDCRYLLTEMSSKANFSFIRSNHKCDNGMATSSDADVDSAVERTDSLEEESHEIDLSAISPALPKKSFSLAAYVNESETLRNLVMLGVNLSKIEEKDIGLAEKLVKLDFEHDVKPVLLFLHQCDVKDSNIGECITRNPHVLCEPVDDMEVRVNYLESKRFSKESIAAIISKEPGVLTATTKETDAQLGYLQQDFMLSGAEVRLVVTKFPRIIVYDKVIIQHAKFALREFLGFSEPELKQIILADPKIYTYGKNSLLKTFDFIHNEIGFSHEHILRWPNILRQRVSVLRPRYQFLKFLKRDQFDPLRENYVSPEALITTTDVEFCNTVAKVPIKQFNDFLKTL